MVRLIRGLPNWVEFAIVVVLAFGYFIRNSVLWLVQNVQGSATADTLWQGSASAITAEHLRFLNLYEPMVFAALLSFLYLRGWTIQRLGAMSLRFQDVSVGLILAAIPTLVLVCATFAVALVEPETMVAAAEGANQADSASVPTVLINSIINPIYEETFVCGYVVSALKMRARTWQSVGVSVAIRVLYHLYLGTLGIANTLVVGLVFGLWYLWRARLWPLVIAHSILDFASLA